MSTEPRYPFLHVDVGTDEADEASALLFEIGATGVEERDESTLAKGPGGDRVLLVASFADRAAADAAREAIELALPGRAAHVEEVVGDGWRDAYKEHYRPFPLTRTITVAPPWVDYAPSRSDERVLVLEPGRAFGTGLHATTSLVAAMLQDRAPRFSGGTVLDAGTGSGILALTALVLGAQRAVAFDIDPEVIGVVVENAARNGLQDRVEVSCGEASELERAFPLVMANIETRVLVAIAKELARAVAPGGELLVSGVLESERDHVVSTFEAEGLRWVETRSSGEHERSLAADDQDRWVAIAFAAET